MYKITDECTTCGACAGECPAEAIHEAADGSKYEIDQDACTDCGTCVDTCPVGAIIQV